MEAGGWGTALAFGLGLFQKHVIKKLPNKVIPWTNLLITSGLGYAMTGDFQAGLTFGVQSTGGAILGHQMLKGATSKTKLSNI